MFVKQEALRVLDNLPETATWDDIFYTLHVKQKIYNGLQDINEGRTISQEEAAERLIPHAN